MSLRFAVIDAFFSRWLSVATLSAVTCANSLVFAQPTHPQEGSKTPTPQESQGSTQAPAPPEPAPGEPVVVVTPPPQKPEAESASSEGQPPPPLPLPDPVQSEEELIIPPYFPVNFSVLYPLSTNAGIPDLWTNVSLAILMGRVGFVDGVQLGLFSWTAHNLRGLQLGLASIVGGRTEGVQVAGAFAFTDEPVTGVQLAGFFGWASQAIDGAQIALVANQTYGDLNGLQAAGFVNIARKQITGVQAVGAVNIGKVDGLQIGAINVSQEQRGLQIGILNVARNIDGVQIGVINITDKLQGESLGIAPIPRRGGIHLSLWGSNSLYGNAGVKFSSVYAYSILSGAFHSDARTDGQPGRQGVYAAGITMGARFPVGFEGFSLSGDLGAYRLFREALTFSRHDEMLKARFIAAYSMVKRLTPFVGGGLFMAFRGDDNVSTRVGPEFCMGLEL